MAERRMFAKTIIDSDAFLDMPLSTQALYFHLSMRADDDGFINNAKKIQRMLGCCDDDLKLLLAKKFIFAFESGVVAIKHWKIHNLIRSDRYKATVYQEEKAQLSLKDNKAYTFGIPNDNQRETQVRLDEVSLVEDSLGEVSIGKEKPVRHKFGEYKNVLLSDEDLEKLKTEFPTDWVARIEKLSSYMASTGKSYKNHLATIRNWARNEQPKETEKPKSSTSGNVFAEIYSDME